ncbi:MAG TPA: phosphoribosylamine--glycine ligase [Thermoanaerobaculia bacterium]|nr:phosphoribosylamine--glycine ligase [Thermoanaerobaculia bacterium]
MRVLLIGSGGREHALAWKLERSPEVEALYCAPGNPGMQRLGEGVPIAIDRPVELADFAAEHAIDLTVVGPELPLSLGLVDELQRRGLAAFGPTRAAARLESSKVFAKQFMVRHGVSTATPFEVVEDEASARRAAAAIGLPLVMKADGLAAGKGVLIVQSPGDLEDALRAFFQDRRFGGAGAQVLVEPFLDGEEVSFMGLSDGRRVLALATSKDYKRVGEGDSGPNTGGMGAHSPSFVLSETDSDQMLHDVLEPTVRGMAAEGVPLIGVVYAGLMLTAEGPRVLEFNIRFGDPEAQVLLLRLEDDLAPLLLDAATGGFRVERLRHRSDAAACIVLASRGYPEKPATGETIRGIEAAEKRRGVHVFHAGTAREGRRLVTAGGRVLNVCALGSTLIDALESAYRAADEIYWPSKVLRRDIGRRVVAGR